VITATLIAGIATLFLTAIAEGIAGGPILRIVFGTLATTLTAPVGGLVAAVLYYRLIAIKGDSTLRGDADPMMPSPLDPTDPPAGPIA
jgi:hypothetical protein